MSVKSVSFSEIGRSWPSQNAHPGGREVAGEHPDLSDEGLCHGSGSSSVRAREDADERDAEVQRQERLHVQVRLAAADVRDRLVGVSDVEVARRGVELAGRVGQQVARRDRGVAGRRRRLQRRGCAAGSSAIESVCACSPPRSPSVWPEPTWIGTRPRRSGSAKFTRPSPPNVVPSSENSAWFWLIGSSWPLHCAQPSPVGTWRVGEDPDLGEEWFGHRRAPCRRPSGHGAFGQSAMDVNPAPPWSALVVAPLLVRDRNACTAASSVGAPA